MAAFAVDVGMVARVTPVKEEFPDDEDLRGAAIRIMDGHIRDAAHGIVGELANVGHTLQLDQTRSPDLLSVGYLAVAESSSHVRLAVCFDVTVSAFRFGVSKLKPSHAVSASAVSADWTRFSLIHFRSDAFSQLAPLLQRALEVEMRARLWKATQEIARARSTPGDDFCLVSASDEGLSEIDYCAFGRRLHLGFSFVATVWNAVA
jgi:hypothetical protein